MLHRRMPRIGIALAGVLLAVLPLIFGQGCPSSVVLEPIDGTIGGGDDTGGSGNTPPTFTFTTPTQDVSREVGDSITIAWTFADPDSNASATLYLDQDENFGNGNERVILPIVFEDTGVTSFVLNTSALAPPLNPGTYRIVAQVSDGANPVQIVVAGGRLLLFGPGLLPGNAAPTIFLTEPRLNLGVSQNDQLALAYCGADVDNGPSGQNPDIILLLDYDNNPSNDLDLSSASAELNLIQACQSGSFPLQINGAIVLGCFTKSTNCASPDLAPNPADPTTPITVTLTVDVAQIPPRPGGDPYFPRATIWDHINGPVHGYSTGTVNVTALGSGLVDLGTVGRTVSGSKFLGFDAGGRAGSTGLDAGDVDGDGVDDFVIASRFGRPFEVGNVGSAHVVMGREGQKFGSEVPLNSVGVLYSGTQLTMPFTTGTQGVASLARVNDVDGDEHPEILVGLPYVEALFDNVIDDPLRCTCPDSDGDDPPVCYGDLLPNPWSADCLDDFLYNRDFREGSNGGFICSNDLDLTQRWPINGGYAILVSSRNGLNGTGGNIVRMGASPISANAVGQPRDGSSPFGARWRGGWYDDFDITETQPQGWSIITDNLFGQTVSTMPPMTNTSLGISGRYGTTVLISAPNSWRGKGSVIYTPGQDFTRFSPNSQSFPYYDTDGFTCEDPGRVIWYPSYNTIVGQAIGDELGYAQPGGDYNLDGSRDILMGAPGADRSGFVDSGIVYVLFGRQDFPSMDLGLINPPRMEIRGTNNGDRFGTMQALVGDLNHDGVPDIGFSSPVADGPAGADAGFVGIVFGGRRLTGENIFTVNQVGTAQLPGVRFQGGQAGGQAGSIISNVGDFNGDGTDDLLICSPNETRTVNGQLRRGVAYLVFGGPHLANNTFFLNQVGTEQLPGNIFVSPYVVGTAEEAPIDFVGAAGDVNADGFADILIGVSLADYVNPLEPSQRRNDAGEMYLIYGSNTGSNVLQ